MDNKYDIEKLVDLVLFEEATKDQLIGISKATIRRRQVFIALAAAASIALLAFAYFGSFNQEPREKYYAESYSFPVITQSRGAQQDITSGFIKDFQQQDYSKAIPAFKDSELTSPRDKYIKGHLQIQAKNYQSAINTFQQITVDSPYYNEAQWNIFLLHYKAGANKKKLKILGQKLAPPYQQKALSLIEQNN